MLMHLQALTDAAVTVLLTTPTVLTAADEACNE